MIAYIIFFKNVILNDIEWYAKNIFIIIPLIYIFILMHIESYLKLKYFNFSMTQ